MTITEGLEYTCVSVNVIGGPGVHDPTILSRVVACHRVEKCGKRRRLIVAAKPSPRGLIWAGNVMGLRVVAGGLLRRVGPVA